MENEKQIFLSYSSNSKEQTSKLAKDLERMGHGVWFDQTLSGGQDWWNEICRNIRKCELFIFVLDKNSQRSHACEVEWRYALELGSKILPVKIADDVSEKILPEALARCQIFDYSNRDIDSLFELRKQIYDIPLPGELPDPLPPQPPAPMSYLNTLAEKVGTFDSLSERGQFELEQTLEQMVRDGTDAQEAMDLLSKLKMSRNLGRQTPLQPPMPASVEFGSGIFDEAALASDEIHQGRHSSREITQAIVRKFIWDSQLHYDRYTFLAPDIPPKKLRRAVKSYGCGVNQSDVLFLYDNTAFGGARDGMMITKDSICWKNALCKRNRVLYSNIGKVSFVEESKWGNGNGVMVNGAKIDITLSSDKAALAKAIEHLIQSLVSVANEPIR